MSPSWSPGYDSVSPTSLCIYIFSYVGAHQLGLDVTFMKSWLRQCIITSLCIYIFSYVGAHQLGLDVAIMKSWLRQCITNESVYIYFQLCWSPPAWFRCHFHEVLATTVYHQRVCARYSSRSGHLEGSEWCCVVVEETEWRQTIIKRFQGFL